MTTYVCVPGGNLHISEGFLPHPWWEIWFAFSLPVVGLGLLRMKKLVNENPKMKPLLALAGAFIFVLSALKIPSVTGSCSHPTGTGLGVILFGPAITAVLGIIALLYQALLLAHGGLTTLGANTASMGIIGPLAAWVFWKFTNKVSLNKKIAVFLTAAMADWITYVVTSLQLALSFPAAQGGILASFKAFLAVFAITQVPIAVIEGILTVIIFKYIAELRSDILVELKVIKLHTAGGNTR